MKHFRRHLKRVQSLRRPGARDLCTPTLYVYHLTIAYLLHPETIRFPRSEETKLISYSAYFHGNSSRRS